MSKINSEDVKLLREKTGSGLMDCKKALAEAEGDMEKAIDLLRSCGLSRPLINARFIEKDEGCTQDIITAIKEKAVSHLEIFDILKRSALTDVPENFIPLSKYDLKIDDAVIRFINIRIRSKSNLYNTYIGGCITKPLSSLDIIEILIYKQFEEYNGIDITRLYDEFNNLVKTGFIMTFNVYAPDEEEYLKSHIIEPLTNYTKMDEFIFIYKKYMNQVQLDKCQTFIIKSKELKERMENK